MYFSPLAVWPYPSFFLTKQKKIQNISSKVLSTAQGLLSAHEKKIKHYKHVREYFLFTFHLPPLPFLPPQIPTHLSLDLKLQHAGFFSSLKAAYVI